MMDVSPLKHQAGCKVTDCIIVHRMPTIPRNLLLGLSDGIFIQLPSLSKLAICGYLYSKLNDQTTVSNQQRVLYDH